MNSTDLNTSLPQTCLQKVSESNLTHVVCSGLFLTTLVIGILATTGAFSFINTTNAVYLSYGMYAGAALFLMAEIGNMVLRCSKKIKDSTKSTTPPQISQSQETSQNQNIPIPPQTSKAPQIDQTTSSPPPPIPQTNITPSEAITENNSFLRYIDKKTKQLVDYLRNEANSSIDDDVFEQTHHLLCKKLKMSRDQFRSKDQTFWELIETKVRKWIIQAYAAGLDSKSICWVTGTRSPALIGISRVAKITQSPALVPTQQLTEWKIVPLTGELAMGIMPKMVNTTALSGAPFSDCGVAYDYSQMKLSVFQHEKELQYILDCDTTCIHLFILRLKIAVLRLIHGGADPSLLDQAQKHIQTNILDKLLLKDWETRARLVGKETKELLASKAVIIEGHPVPKGTLVGVTRTDRTHKIAMVCQYNNLEETYTLTVDHKGTTKCVSTKNVQGYDQEALLLRANQEPALTTEAQECFKSNIADKHECQKAIESILELFKTEKVLELSSEENDLINESFPIIWGVTTEEKESMSLKFFRVRSDISEFGYQGILKIGSEIKVAFTKKSKIEKLKQWLHDQNVTSVKMISFGSMIYLHALNTLDTSPTYQNQ